MRRRWKVATHRINKAHGHINPDSEFAFPHSFNDLSRDQVYTHAVPGNKIQLPLSLIFIVSYSVSNQVGIDGWGKGDRDSYSGIAQLRV